jgi:hypothetical protein
MDTIMVEEYNLKLLIECENHSKHMKQFLDKVNDFLFLCFKKTTDVRELETPGKWSILVILIKKEIIGMACLFHKENNTIHIYNLCTSHNHRNKGIMKQLFRYMHVTNPTSIFHIDASNTDTDTITENIRLQIYSTLGFHMLTGTKLILNTNEHVEVLQALHFPSSRKIMYSVLRQDKSKDIIYINQIQTCEKIQPYGEHPLGCFMISDSITIYQFMNK